MTARSPARPPAGRREARPGLSARLFGGFDRGADRRLARPPEVVLDLDARPAGGRLVALAAQQVAVQSIYFVLPGIVAAAFGAEPLAAVNFLCLSLLGMAAFALLQGLARGIVGSGYPIPGIPSPVLLAAYLLAAQSGASLGEAAALTIATGVGALLTLPLFRRLSALIPTEVAGVVVFLIGASLLPLVIAAMHLDAAAPRAALPGAAVTLGTVAVMVIVAIGRTRLAPFAVLCGMAVGIAVALGAGMAHPAALPLLEEAVWVALPRPVPPEAGPATLPLLGVFLVCLVPIQASLLGNLIAFQRAADAEWRRPDPPPLRRGLLAQGLAVIATGAIGGMAPAVSSAAVGLSIATGTLARRIALAGAAAFLLLAFCPKPVMLFVLLPDPVKAAMLLYVAGFMMAQGCQMVAARMLDARRTAVAGLGLGAGLAVLIEPEFFAAGLPALAAPLSFGALVAFLANLLTLPLVARRTRFVLPLGAGLSPAVEARLAALGGAWGLRRETVERLQHALTELGDLLAGRGLGEVSVTATRGEERVVLRLDFVGEPLPPAAVRPRARDLEEGAASLEAFAVWMATRHAVRHAQRGPAQGRMEFLLEFED